MPKFRIVRWDETCRVVEVGLIYVTQDIEIRDLKPGVPRINWKAIGAVGVKEARSFSVDLERAIVLANSLKNWPGVPWKHPGAKAAGVKLPNGLWLSIVRPKGKAGDAS